MPELPPLTPADYARIERLLAKHGIDADDPERLERLVLAMAPKPVGKPYGKVVEDFVILEAMGNELEKRKKSGLVPSIKDAARILATKEPFKVWGMTARAILKRENEMLRRLRSGEGLQPELESLLQKRLDGLADEARRQAEQGEK